MGCMTGVWLQAQHKQCPGTAFVTRNTNKDQGTAFVEPRPDLREARRVAPAAKEGLFGIWSS